MRRSLAVSLVFILLRVNTHAQQGVVPFLAYNGLTGSICGGIGAIINKPTGMKWQRAFAKGFITGLCGGVVMYAGKQINGLVVSQNETGYGYAARLVYSAGNSVVENAAACRPFWQIMHYDFAFIRLEYDFRQNKLTPRVMPSMLGAFIFTSCYGKPDWRLTFSSGTFAFRTSHIKYAPELAASTTGNFFLIVDSIADGKYLFDVVSHEQVHTFQFADHTSLQSFIHPHWNLPPWSKYVFADLNYETMLINYFIVCRGYSGQNYNGNFLESEAEYLSNGRSPSLKFR